MICSPEKDLQNLWLLKLSKKVNQHSKESQFSWSTLGLCRKLYGHWKMLQLGRMTFLSLLKSCITCYVLSHVKLHFDVAHIHKDCEAESWQYRRCKFVEITLTIVSVQKSEEKFFNWDTVCQCCLRFKW